MHFETFTSDSITLSKIRLEIICICTFRYITLHLTTSIAEIIRFAATVRLH